MKRFNLLPALALSLSLLSAPFAGLSLDDETQDPVNQKDDQGRKQGDWVYYGKDVNDPNYDPDDKVEEGPYKDDRKHGTWKTYYPGNKLKSEIEYKYNRPNGAYTKYYENGNTSESGTWKGNKYTGEFKKYHENGQLSQEKTFNQAGKTEGTVRYIYPNGKTEFEFSTNNGVETGKATRYYPNGDVKEELNYSGGKVTSSEPKERVNPPAQVEEKPTKAAPKEQGSVNDADKGKDLTDEYKKTYNENGDLLMDGLFKGGKLYDGKWYKYDSNGLLYKIEIYKEGRYFGDGVLEF